MISGSVQFQYLPDMMFAAQLTKRYRNAYWYGGARVGLDPPYPSHATRNALEGVMGHGAAGGTLRHEGCTLAGAWAMWVVCCGGVRGRVH